jgi:hypothetical protein
MTVFSLVFYIASFSIMTNNYNEHSRYRETVIYLQVSLSIEMLIFNCREPEEWLWSSAPCLGLGLSVFLANVLVIIFALTGVIVAMVNM